MDYNQIYNKIENDKEKMNELRIMVVGKSGAGKTTLIKEIFGDLDPHEAKEGIGLPVTEEIRDYTSKNSPMILTDTVGFVSLDENKDTIRALEKRFKSRKMRPHLVWYVINATSNRIEEGEIECIKWMSSHVPVIVVLSQAISVTADILRDRILELNLPIIDVIPILARDYYLKGGQLIESFGVFELIYKSYETLNDKEKESFAAAQVRDVKLKAKAARTWARAYIAATFGVGFVPIPFSDAGLLVPIQMTMMVHIAHIFGMKTNKDKLKSLITVGLLPEGAKLVGRSVTANALKWIPGVGTLVGGLIQGTTAAAITWTMTEAYIKVLEKTYGRGRDIIDDDVIKDTIDAIRKKKELES